VPLIDFDAQDSAIDGLEIITIKQVSDERGTVREFFRLSAYASALADTAGGFAQINVTFTKRGAIRGLHGEAMTKLVAVAAGEAFGVYVDARHDSPTFGAVVTATLAPGTQVLVPRGVLNGFQSTGSDGSEYLYCFDVEWQPDMPGIGAHPLDPDLGIAWPIEIDPADRSLVSAKDAALPRFSELRPR
jgi:dTDP-4-dehydrorhamnose 3,5-epimerase